MPTQHRDPSWSLIDDYLPEYLNAAKTGQRRAAVGIALALLAEGFSAESVIKGLLVRSQADVGLGWMEGRWTVAMEHRASEITESALQAVAATALRAPTAPVEGSAGRVIVACSEGEWHIMPARMMCEILRLRGAEISFVGPSFPAHEIGLLFQTDPAEVVAVTCSLSSSLPGAWSTISALRAVGMRILCGGRGFGSDGRWAYRLGADQWAADFSTGADLLLTAVDEPIPPPREPVGDPQILDELRVLRRDHQSFVQHATNYALDAWPNLRASDSAVSATRRDLDATLNCIEAATLVQDGTLVSDYVDWFETVLASRDLPISFVSTAFWLLRNALPVELTAALSMTEAGLTRCSAPMLPHNYHPNPGS